MLIKIRMCNLMGLTGHKDRTTKKIIISCLGSGSVVKALAAAGNRI